MLKVCLTKLLSSAIEEFEKLDKKKTDDNYVYWHEDPTALSWLKKVFKEHMELQGCMACLQPWATPTSAPQLSVEQVPLRILLRGDSNHWRVLPAEDLREISMSQWREPLSIEEDWFVALFGGDSMETPQPSSTTTSAKPGQPQDEPMNLP